MFGLDITRNTTNKFKSAAAQIYEHTYNELLKGLSGGRLLHIDETSISIKEGNGYVWVLTTMEEVAYFYTPTREGSKIQSMLKNFSGVLVTDFYAAYDLFLPVLIAAPQGRWLQLSRSVSKPAIDRNEWYNDFIVRSGIADILAAKVYEDDKLIEKLQHYYRE